MTAALKASPADSNVADERRYAALAHQIEHLAHFLPAQGPITAFVHHNTLHAFEHLPFAEAVIQGARTFGCHPYLPEERYRKELAHERILVSDLEAVLRDELGDRANDPLISATRLELRLAMMKSLIMTAPRSELRWFVAESDALKTFRQETPEDVRIRMIEDTRHWAMRDLRPGSTQTSETNHRARLALESLFSQFGEGDIEQWSDADWESFVLHVLWRACYDGVQTLRPFTEGPHAPARHRDLFLEHTGIDPDHQVNDVLIRFCSAFLDQGMSNWPLPDRDRGFFAAFIRLYSAPSRALAGWMQDVQKELQKTQVAGRSPLESIQDSLRLLGVDEADQEMFLLNTLLALPGWGGMLWQLETRSDRAPIPAPAGSLTEFLAIRLILDRCALRHLAADHIDYHAPLDTLRDELCRKLPRHDIASIEPRAFQVFQVSQFLGWKPRELFHLSRADWSILISEIEGFSNLERRRVFQIAYERRYINPALDAISLRASMKTPPRTTPKFQATFCIDDREESIRRHIEEICPAAETLSVAGFYGVAMYYRGVADAHFTPLCPIVIKPRHYVQEQVVEQYEDSHRRRALQRRVLGAASHQVHVGSRTGAGGAILTTLLGPLATAPLLGRVLAPRLAGQIRRRAAKLIQPHQATQLRLERIDAEPGPEGNHVGYSLDEMIAVGERILRELGLTSHFARIVLVFGHGSNSLNNPHKAAYDCGACAGAVGGPNARALAQMLNDPRIRRGLTERGIVIPDTSHFIGGWHNTCDDALSFYDLDRVPQTHQLELAEVLQIMEYACDRNAHERSRRFQSARLDMSFDEAHRHVQERSEDLAQTRPELGHATNALTMVGRRSRTRGLFMDRRVFLTSYDPTVDNEESTVLKGILGAVFPVCAGISLEYYFSHVDNVGFGSGTKLPHNVASLLGVMDGPTSDLRTGLPWQMVEIHEPMRHLFVIETRPEVMLQAMESNPGIKTLVTNEWVYLATLDPDSDRIDIYRNGQFEPYTPESRELPSANSSPDWYRGWRDHLGFALIRDAMKQTTSEIHSASNGRRS